MKKSSQTELYGEVLTDEQQYRFEVEGIEPLPREEEPALLERARQGDQEARQTLIERAFIRYISRIAARLVRTYHWASARIEYLDLVQEGNIAVLQTFDTALQKERPLTYAKAVAKYEMMHYCQKHASVITTPTEEHFYVVDSLDTPCGEEEDATRADFVSDERDQPTYRKDPLCRPISYEDVHKAIGLLTPTQQAVVTRLYGICGQDVHTQQAIADAMGYAVTSVPSIRNCAVKKLQSLLPVVSTQKDLYTVEQACLVLGITRAGFHKTLRLHNMSACTLGLYRKEDIERLMQRKTHVPNKSNDPSRVTCACPGCTAPVQITKYGTPSLYCSPRCARRMHAYRQQQKTVPGGTQAPSLLNRFA